MREIPISKGKYAIVDDTDFEWLSRFKWHVDSDGSARKNGKPGEPRLMHRLITDAPAGKEVEHINRNRLDNRRSNLRIVSRAWRGRKVGDKEWLKSKMKPSGDCLLYSGYVNNTGYCKIKFQGRMQYAHRVSYIIFNGDIPENMQIDHLCRSRSCINPEHLEIVTAQENIKRSLPFRKKNKNI